MAMSIGCEIIVAISGSDEVGVEQMEVENQKVSCSSLIRLFLLSDISFIR